MAAPALAAPLLRPEWLFEIVQRVQALAGCGSGACPDADALLAGLPPESPLEHEIICRMLDDVRAEQSRWVAQASGSPEDAPAATPRAARAERLAAAVVRARALLQQDCAAHWTVERLARRVGCNRTDLETAFRRHCGHCVHAYLVICRVEAAKTLLRDSAWRIEEIARASGWRSKVSLYEHFGVTVGMTPDEYRRRWTPVPANEAVRERLSRGTPA
jgi:transcriptional regulator GlxA family with amidase domain